MDKKKLSSLEFPASQASLPGWTTLADCYLDLEMSQLPNITDWSTLESGCDIN